MKNLRIIGIVILAFGISYIGFYLLWTELTKPDSYRLSDKIIYPGESILATAVFDDKDQILISVLTRDWFSYEITISTEDGELVKKFTSNGNDRISFAKPFGSGKFQINTTNMDDEPIRIWSTVRDYSPTESFPDPIDSKTVAEYTVIYPSILIITSGTILLFLSRSKSNNHV